MFSEIEYLHAREMLSRAEKLELRAISYLKGLGLTEEQIKVVLDPGRAFKLDLEDEVRLYERGQLECSN